MSRIEENRKAITDINEVLEMTSYKSEATRTLCYFTLLADISTSLAVIADKMGEEEPENCVGCKRCRRHYDDRYERRVTE